MAAKLDVHAKTLIQTLVAEGLTSAEIHRRITEGDENHAPIDVTLRTIQTQVSLAKAELKIEPDPLDGSDEITTLDAINRGFIRTIHREERRFALKSKQGKLTDADRDSMRLDAKVAAEIRRYFAKGERPAGAPLSDGHGRKGGTEPVSILDRIAEAEAERGGDEPPPAA